MIRTPKKKLVYDVSAGAVQMLVTQLSGAVIFFLLSNYLSKQDIGMINWCLAILMIIYAMLGFGMDQVVVKNIAMGADTVALLSTYLIHVIITGCVFMGCVLACYFILPGKNNTVSVFALLAVCQLFLFLSGPFKQAANGTEQFKSLMAMSITANAIRITGLLALIFMKSVSLLSVLFLYIFSSFMELIACLLIHTFFLHTPIRIRWNKKQYKSLVTSSVPQLGVIFFTALLSRIDWVLLGLLSSSAIVADYSFTYRAFELSTTPLLVLGMLLLPRVAKLFVQKNNLSAASNTLLVDFAKKEMLLAVFTMLMLHVCWAPVMDGLTGGKYGAHNSSIIFILSLSIPLLYINNILWSLDFAQGKLKSILRIFLFTCLVNIAADAILIPLFSGLGAAAGFCVAILVQTVLYFKKTSLVNYLGIFWQLLLALASATIAAWMAFCFFDRLLEKIACSAIVYLLLLFGTGGITFNKNSLLTSLAKI